MQGKSSQIKNNTGSLVINNEEKVKLRQNG